MKKQPYTLGLLGLKLDQIEKKVDSIDVKVEGLTAWRWRVVGGATVVSILIGIFIKLAH